MTLFTRDQNAKVVPLGLDINQQKAELASAATQFCMVRARSPCPGNNNRYAYMCYLILFLSLARLLHNSWQPRIRTSPQKAIDHTAFSYKWTPRILWRFQPWITNQELRVSMQEDWFPEKGIPRGHDEGRAPTCLASHIRNWQMFGCWRYATFIISWAIQLYAQNFFFKGSCLPSNSREPGDYQVQKVGVKRAFKTAHCSHYFSLLLNALQIIVTLITQQCLLYHAILLICCYQYIFIMSKQQKKRNVNFKCCVFKAPWSVDYFKFSGTITHLHCVIMQ